MPRAPVAPAATDPAALAGQPLGGVRGVPGEHSRVSTLEMLNLTSNKRSDSIEIKGGQEFCGFHTCLVYCQNIQVVWQHLAKPGEE